MKKPTLFLIALLTTLVSSYVQSEMYTDRDTPGSKDYPLISRYPGSFIYQYHVTDYDEYRFATGPMKDKKIPTEVIEGKYTTIVYTLPDKLSTFQVFKNYQEAFKKAGVKQVLSCDQSSCGEYMPLKFMEIQGGGQGRTDRYRGINMYTTNLGSDYRFWTGILERNNKKFYFTFMVSKTSYAHTAFLDIVETKKMELGLVKLDLNSMDESMKAKGRVVLSGLFFDTDKATLQPKSRESMDVIASYLKKYPNKKFYVVGHTDSVGTYDHNLQLSRQRAAAVVQVLHKDYGIPLNRLTAVGVGPVSPMADNENEEGRRQNRRVELVSQ